MKWIFVVVLLYLLVGVGSATFEDNVQYHWDMDSDGFGDIDDLKDLWNPAAPYGSCYGSASISITQNYLSYGQSIYIYSKSGYGSYPIARPCDAIINSSVEEESTYWAFTVRDFVSHHYWDHAYPCGHQGWDSGYIDLQFYGKTKNLLGSYRLLTDPYHSSTYNYGFLTDYHNNDLYEVVITSGIAYLFINGSSQGILGACAENPYYIGFYVFTTGGECSNGATSKLALSLSLTVDDITTDEGIVGIGAEPCLTGSFTTHIITDATNPELDVSYHAETIPFDEYTAAQYDIKVKRATWDQWYNVTRVKDSGDSTTKPCGIIEYNWTELFNTDHYGLYWFDIYKTGTGEPESMGQDFLYFKDIGEPSTINIEDTEYAVGETMNISYYIDSPDFGANQYKIQIFDATGQLKDERVLTQQAATEQITSTIDWEEGLLYAVLVKDTKPAITEDPPEDIIDLAYDFCTLSNVIYITGKVWDASNADNLVDGTLLDNVSLNWTQAGTIYNTTSDTNGNYEFTDATTLLEVEWFQDVPIEVHAEKTGYTHDDFIMTIIKAGRYTIDIYLVPTPDPDSNTISGLVADDIFHQAIHYAEVNLWNGISNTTYTNLWGYYETCIIPNGTYRMQAEKETFQTSEVVIVNTDNISLSLDDCDECNYNEAVLDACDATTGWSSDNTLTLNTTDYVEGTGALQSYGYNATDFYKTFSPAIDANVSEAHGYFYFYSKIDNVTNISSNNVTVKISSNATGANDLFIWNLNKSSFNTTWDLYMLKISEATEVGNCNLTNITYFRWESTKSTNVTTKIDGLAFIEYAGWDSCVDLSVDTSDKVEGTGSLNASGLLRAYCNLAVGVPFTPTFNADTIGKTSDLSRLSYWRKHTNNYTHIESVCLVDSDGDTLCWQTDISGLTWQKQELFLKNAIETGDFNTNAISYLSIYDLPYAITIRYDDIRLIQSGQVQQNFYLSQYFDLTVRAKDADTRFTITDFTAILDTTNVKETTTGTIVFTNITYAIYPLEVSSDGYYTNKQYVFMGQDTEQTVYLTKIEDPSGGEGVGQYYAPPHLVEFRVENIWGRPYENVNINITAQQTTMGAWEWLASVFGYRDEIAAEIQNGSMNGTTDTYGAMSFMMTETVKYKVHCYNASQGIDKTVYVYPKEERYIIVCSVIKWQQEGTEEMRELTINVTSTTINDTHANITIEYDDPSNATIDLTFYVNRTTNYNKQENVGMYNVANDSNVTHSFTVTPISGRSFFVRVVTENSEWGTKTWDFAVKFPGLRFDLGLPSIVYPIMAIALILFTGGLFGASSATQGSLICCLEGWIFLGMGWFSSVAPVVTMGMALSLATVVSILAIIIEKGRRTGVQ